MPTILFENQGVKRVALFSFVPKTGGSALIRFFQMIGARAFLHTENNEISSLLKCPSQHFHYELLDEVYRLDRFHFSFMVVRNPVDRAKSDYLWSFRKLKDRASLPSFEQWFRAMIEQYRKDPYAFDNHIRPQHEFGGPAIRKVYKYEDGLEHVAIDVLKNLNLAFSKDEGGRFVPRENTAEQYFGQGMKSADVPVSAEALALLKEFYRKDFESFYPEALMDG